ncbi:MAG: hypothetical protein LAQ69_47505 [Acidobacteriia bacterium]|nr:hypothetical protein [Terriglobia bacterium]
MYQIVSVEAPPLHTVNPAIPQQVSKVVAKALAKKPEDRFSSCKEFAARLADALAARADQDAVETATMQPVAPTRRRRWALVAIAAALAVVGLAGVASWKWPSKIPPAQPPAQTAIPPSQAPAAPKDERTIR